MSDSFIVWLNGMIPQLLGVVGMIGVAILTGQANISAKRQETAARRVEGATPSYDALDQRVVRLENQVGTLRAEIDKLIAENRALEELAHKQHYFIEQHVPVNIHRPFNPPQETP